ncbi:MAG: ComF family protein [Candidatus Paceibacterota bacterium]|jgi:ComF family protein
MVKNYPHNYPCQLISPVIKKILSFIFPPRCVRCGLVGSFLCDNCLPQLTKSDGIIEDGIIAAFDYHDPAVKKAIHYLKYRRIKDLTATLANKIYETFLNTTGDELIFNRGNGKIIVVPVPLYRKRMRERGFNQAEELANLFCILDPENFEVKTDLIFKIKNTPPQAQQKKRVTRLKNLKNAFAIRKHPQIAGKIVVIIDDVATTGSTINEIKKILLKNGVRRIYAVVVAHG